MNAVLNDEQQKQVEENIRLAYWFAQKIEHREATKRCGMDYDDCVSIGMEALCKAAIYANTQYAFSTTFMFWARALYHRVIKHDMAKRRRDKQNNISLETVVCGEGDHVETIGGTIQSNELPMDEYIETMYEIECAMEVIAKQPAVDQRMFMLYAFEGWTKSEIARMLGRSAQYVGVHIRNVQTAIKAARKEAMNE